MPYYKIAIGYNIMWGIIYYISRISKGWPDWIKVNKEWNKKMVK